MTNDVVITGIGIVSSLGMGVDAHKPWLTVCPTPVFDRDASPPFPIHQLAPVDYDRFIPKKSDQKQMGLGQRLGVVAAGLALEDGGILGNADILQKTHLHVAAGGGERDVALDDSIMSEFRSRTDFEPYLNERLSRDLRPTLFLAQLPNLFAGNISIALGVTGSSRTFMGEEVAGLEAIAKMAARIKSGAVDIGLAGGAFAATDDAMQWLYGFNGSLWQGEPVDIWSRVTGDGGMILSAVGAFVLMESRAHAEARGARIAAVIDAIHSGYTTRQDNRIAQSAEDVWHEWQPALHHGALGILSGATGLQPVTSQELDFLSTIGEQKQIAIRGTGSVIGHALEAALPANVALAAMALREGGFLKPSTGSDIETDIEDAVTQVLVTNIGHWRGEGMMLLTRNQAGAS